LTLLRPGNRFRNFTFSRFDLSHMRFC
jgi:hypothetical protein